MWYCSLVTLQVYTAKEHGSKNYTRIDYCFYCEKAVKSRISRHYARKHSERSAVQEALKLVGHQRQRAFAKIQNQGNFKHNMKVSVTIPTQIGSCNEFHQF